MGYKKKIYYILVASVILAIISLILALPEYSGLCRELDSACIDAYIYRYDALTTSLLIFSACLFSISIILLFLREQIFLAWSKFSIIFFPIAVVLITMTPTTSGTLVGFDKESATLWLAIAFLIASILIIAIKSFKLRGMK